MRSIYQRIGVRMVYHTTRKSSVRRTATPASTLPTVRDINIAILHEIVKSYKVIQACTIIRCNT